MKIYNQDKTQLLNENEIDFTKGTLKLESVSNNTTKTFIENGIVKTETIENEPELVYVFVPFTEKELKEQAISELEFWFVETYEVLFQKYLRKASLGLTLNDGSDPQEKLRELYLLAESKASTLHNLREELKNM